MGKMLSGLIAAIFMAGGLTALTVGEASAACPYSGCIDTRCHADNVNNPRVGHPARVEFRVGTSGNGAARGTATFTYKRVNSGTVVGRYQRDYVGPHTALYKFSGLPVGKYVVRVFFNSQPRNSVYKNCGTSFRQTVQPR